MKGISLNYTMMVMFCGPYLSEILQSPMAQLVKDSDLVGCQNVDLKFSWVDSHFAKSGLHKLFMWHILVGFIWCAGRCLHPRTKKMQGKNKN